MINVAVGLDYISDHIIVLQNGMVEQLNNI